MLTPKEIAEIQRLKEEGNSIKEIEEKTKRSYKTIKKYLEPDDVESSEDPIDDGISKENSIIEDDQVKTGNPKRKDPFSIKTEFDLNPQIPTQSSRSSPVYDHSELEESFIKPEEAIVEVRGIPIGKKIQFTPKNLTMWEWFKSQYQGWENSDISDFINQCMDYFFKTGLGAKMKIEVVQEYA